MRGSVYTIPAHLPFADALAAGLWTRLGERSDALADARVYLPTRRACRALMLAFMRRSGGAPLLLPRMIPLGDIDADELAFEDSDGSAEADLDQVPPAVPALRRQVLLTGAVAALPGAASGPGQAARLASALARLFDQVHTERLDLARLRDLVPDELARHWQITLDFLLPLAERWQAMLRAEGAVDPARRRTLLLEAQAARWRAQPPEGVVVAAGSTGSVPASADLLAVIARLPQGAVVLPGLDTTADAATWACIDAAVETTDALSAPAHPQYGMARLLRRCGIDRAHVEPWPAPGIEGAPPARAAFVARALAPAAAPAWRRPAEPPAPAALNGVTVVECAGSEEEARVVALVLREALETPGKTAALVTPDRTLARRVAVELQRWAIAVDDSGGTALSQTRAGVFVRLLAGAVAENLAPVPLLSLLDHPLAAAGFAPETFRRDSRRLQLALLRGLRPAPGIAGLRAAAESLDHRDRLLPMLDALDRVLAPLSRLAGGGAVSLGALVEAHVAAAEAVATSNDEPGAARLWAGEDGEALAAFFADLLASAGEAMLLTLADYPELLDALLQDCVVRPAWGRHPRLAIFGPLEARLQHADLLVLGSLNEDSWPPAARASPWMSRPMLQQFGLPLPERRIGLSAHDFCQAFAATEVVLTRARRVEGAPTVPSRWLRRLQALTQDSAWARESEARAARLRALQSALFGPGGGAGIPATPPAPTPPVAARPRRLSVTRIETWMRDPYALYAREVLQLRPLDPIDAEPDPSRFGTAIHAALSRFVAAHPQGLPDDALDRLLAEGRTALGELLQRPAVNAFWWPRFARLAGWFLSQHRARLPDLEDIACEIDGRIVVPAPAGPFTLTAKADRIDRRGDGTLAVIDYKTGTLPSDGDVGTGLSPQLILEALIAEAGGFTGLPGRPVAALEYWRLGVGDAGGVCRAPVSDLPAAVAAARDGLVRLVGEFDDPATPYLALPRRDKRLSYDDYAHLARHLEWSTGEDAEE